MMRGLLAFGYPVLDDGRTLYLGDRCYRHTLEVVAESVAQRDIVARRRRVGTVSARWPQLSPAEGRLAVGLPDFGSGGLSGARQLLHVLSSPSLRRRLAELALAADLVFVEAPSVEAYVVTRAARAAGRPVVMEMRGDVMINRAYLADRLGRAAGLYAWFMSRLFAIVRHQAIAGLYVSDSLAATYPVAGPLSMAVSDVRIPDEYFSGARRFDHPARRFLFVGHLEAVKRVDWILRGLAAGAARLPADWSLTVVGEGPAALELEFLSRQLGIHERTTFCGGVAWGPELFGFYREADVLLVSSVTEGSPRAVLEAMATGLPVFATGVGRIPEVLGEGAHVQAQDFEAFVAGLLRFARDPAGLSDASRHNAARAEAFRWTSISARRRDFHRKAMDALDLR